jgi:hypothetical protein
VLALGGVLGPSPSEVLSIGSVSGLTTTMGGAGEALSGGGNPRWGTEPPKDVEEFDLPEERDPFELGREWLLVLLARLLRLVTADTGVGRGLLAFRGGGGAAAAAAAADEAFESFAFEAEGSFDLVLLSCCVGSESAFGHIEQEVDD